jgi:hypothetical protein
VGVLCSKLEAVVTRCFAVLLLVALTRLGAQQPGSRHVRFVTVETDGTSRRVVGHLRDISGDSIAVWLDETGGVAKFARLTIVDLEEEHRFGQQRAVTIGCVVAGGILAVVGYRGSRTSDGVVPAPEGAAVGAAVGCSVGALVGAVLAHQSQWRPMSPH